MNLNPQIENDIDLFTFRRTPGAKEVKEGFDDIYFVKKVELLKEHVYLKYDTSNNF